MFIAANTSAVYILNYCLVLFITFFSRNSNIESNILKTKNNNQFLEKQCGVFSGI